MSETPVRAAARIRALLDAGSFVEIGACVTARNTDFNLTAGKKASDGVVTGYGTVNGDLVYVFSQDPDVMHGTIGEMHAKKITNILRMAAKMGAPVVGLIDSRGLRLEEATDAMASLGSIYRQMAKNSGVVPQIIGIFGGCGGGLSFLSGLADFTFMEKDTARLFVSSPDALPGSNRELCDLSTADMQAKAGNADFVGTEAELFTRMRSLLAILPLNYEDEGYADECGDDLNRVTPQITSYAADTLGILQQVSDSGIVVETGQEFGKGVVTAFIRLNGSTVGAVAARTAYTGEDGESVKLDGKLGPRGIFKAAGFIRFCDAFNIPVLTIAQAEGFRAQASAEKPLPRTAASLINAYASSTVPKVTLNIGRSFGSAAVVLGSKSVGADYVYAWPDAVIGTMDGMSAAKLMFEGEDAETLKEKAAEYDALSQSAASAAARGYVDTVIDPSETRKYLIGAFEMLYSKREDVPDKKHSTI